MLLRRVGWLLFFTVSCNFYEPFNRRSASEQYLEMATRCQHQGDRDCAIENLLLLPEGEEKNRKLCAGYLSRIGFRTQPYLDVINGDGSYLLGNLSQATVPWSENRSRDAEQALQICARIQGKLGQLLSSIALVVDCAVRIAKSDVVVASSTSDSVCQTPGNGNGLVQRDDVISDNTVMCPQDAIACRNDLMGPVISKLEDAGAQELKAAIDALPQALKDSSTGASLLLIAIRSAISP